MENGLIINGNSLLEEVKDPQKRDKIIIDNLLDIKRSVSAVEGRIEDLAGCFETIKRDALTRGGKYGMMGGFLAVIAIYSADLLYKIIGGLVGK